MVLKRATPATRREDHPYADSIQTVCREEKGRSRFLGEESYFKKGSSERLTKLPSISTEYVD